MLRTLVPALCLALCAAVALVACDRSAANDATPAPMSIPAPRIPADVHSKVKLGETTPAAVEELFGAPDQRGADGALVYESTRTRQSGKVERETATFRFDGDILTKVCQSRS